MNHFAIVQVADEDGRQQKTSKVEDLSEVDEGLDTDHSTSHSTSPSSTLSSKCSWNSQYSHSSSKVKKAGYNDLLPPPPFRSILPALHFQSDKNSQIFSFLNVLNSSRLLIH